MMNEYFCWCVSAVGWHRQVGTMVKDVSDAAFEEMARVPIRE